MSKATIALQLETLWFVGKADGMVTHGEGYALPLPTGCGQVVRWLVERSPGNWDIVSVNSTHAAAFNSAEGAAKYLERWCQERRASLGAAFRALPMLLDEMIGK